MNIEEFKTRILAELKKGSGPKDEWLVVYFSADSDRYYGESNALDRWDVLMIIMELIDKYKLNPVAITAMYQTAKPPRKYDSL